MRSHSPARSHKGDERRCFVVASDLEYGSQVHSRMSRGRKDNSGEIQVSTPIEGNVFGEKGRMLGGPTGQNFHRP